MNLTLFFIVCSIAVTYYLYDTFKKSKKVSNKPSLNDNNRLRIKHSHECKILHGLQAAKIESVKTKIISINLGEEPCDASHEEQERIKEILKDLKRTRRIYLLLPANQPLSKMQTVSKQIIGTDSIIPYHSLEGAVAILRQLQPGIHLESNNELYLKIRQYLNNIWLRGNDEKEQARREFSTQKQMILFLANIQNLEE